jgi:uncharacterized OB-fold protein
MKKYKVKKEIKTKIKNSGRATPPLKIKTGMALKNEDLTSGALCLTSFKPKLDYEWDSGIAIGEYLKGLKNGSLLGIKCKHCNRILIPPRIVCEWCFKPMSEWVQLLDTGTVNTFSLCYITWNMQRRTEPQIPAVIDIDGASKGVGILHLLGEIEPRKVRIGMRVKAVWKTAEERQGAITDIKYFKPL